jgi:hypothetical protein
VLLAAALAARQVSGGVYRRSEVLFLLSISAREIAELVDADVVSSAGGLSSSHSTSLSPGDRQPLPLIVKWWDVQQARRAVRAALSEQHDRAVQHETDNGNAPAPTVTAEQELVTALRLAGHTEQQIAERLGVSDSTARRRFVSTIDAILAALGGEATGTEAQSKPAACLKCASRPRCRIVSYGVKVRGKPRPRFERPSALCVPCLHAAAARAGREPPETTTLVPHPSEDNAT